jgi:hypothetical protein
MTRPLLVLSALVVATLACATDEVPLTPITPEVGTPVVIAPLPTDTLAPTVTDTPDLTAAARMTAVTDTPPPTEMPTVTPAPNVSPTSIIALPPTATSTASPTPPPSPTATITPTPTRTTRPGAATPTGRAPTATRQVAGSAPQPLPAGARLTREYEISGEGGQLVGNARDVRDAREITWASLRGEGATWVIAFADARQIVGVRLFAQRDGAEEDPVTLTRIEVSADGQTWTDAYVPAGECGVPNCLAMIPLTYQEIGFTATEARFLRLRSGPTRFAFGEIEVALAP